MFAIKYGIRDNHLDVTEICYNKLCRNNIIKIPNGDIDRSKHFGDPLYGILKSIFVVNPLNEMVEYEHFKEIHINILTKMVQVIDDNVIENKLNKLQRNLQIQHGSFSDEYPEQLMATRYLTGNEKVLEIGGNIGRNSLIIASILKEKNNYDFVTLECDTDIANQLKDNRDINKLYFFIENSALSKRKLIQNGWDTIPSDELLEGYKSINIIDLETLHFKYNIKFDTLVLDCEGAFYYILLDMPEILNNINLIIMENDYTNIDHKKYIDQTLQENGFYLDYQKNLPTWGPSKMACIDNFYEVWKR